MGLHPVKTQDFIAFLNSLNYQLVRIKASHSMYNIPGNNKSRPIVIRESDKEIPGFHIKSNLKTMGKTLEDLNKFLGK